MKLINSRRKIILVKYNDEIIGVLGGISNVKYQTFLAEHVIIDKRKTPSEWSNSDINYKLFVDDKMDDRKFYGCYIFRTMNIHTRTETNEFFIYTNVYFIYDSIEFGDVK